MQLTEGEGNEGNAYPFFYCIQPVWELQNTYLSNMILSSITGIKLLDQVDNIYFCFVFG